MSEQLHILGKITGYYGVKGWLKIYSYTQPRENIIRYKALKIRPGSSQKVADEWQDIELDNGKAHGKGVVAHFVGYDNREIAASLIGAELATYRSHFKPASKDEYYWTDLIELLVINLQGIELGKVSSLIETEANDVLVISPMGNAADKNDILIPFVVDHYVKKVDLQAGSIMVDWPADWNESSTSK